MMPHMGGNAKFKNMKLDHSKSMDETKPEEGTQGNSSEAGNATGNTNGETQAPPQISQNQSQSQYQMPNRPQPQQMSGNKSKA